MYTWWDYFANCLFWTLKFVNKASLNVWKWPKNYVSKIMHILDTTYLNMKNGHVPIFPTFPTRANFSDFRVSMKLEWCFKNVLFGDKILKNFTAFQSKMLSVMAGSIFNFFASILIEQNFLDKSWKNQMIIFDYCYKHTLNIPYNYNGKYALKTTYLSM